MIGLLRGCFYSQANTAIQSEPTFIAHEPKGSGRVEGMLLNSTYCSLLIRGGGSELHYLMFYMLILLLLHDCNCYLPQNMPILLHEGEVHVVNDCPTTIFVTLASRFCYVLLLYSFIEALIHYETSGFLIANLCFSEFSNYHDGC